MRDWLWLFLFSARASGAPHCVAVDGHDEIVDVDGEVGIYAFGEVYPHGYGRHHHRGEPYAGVGMVLPPEVEESHAEAQYFKDSVHVPAFRS